MYRDAFEKFQNSRSKLRNKSIQLNQCEYIETHHSAGIFDQEKNRHRINGTMQININSSNGYARVGCEGNRRSREFF